MKGLPRDTGGAVILEGLSQSKQKEKQVKKSCRQTAGGSVGLFWTGSRIWQPEKTTDISRLPREIERFRMTLKTGFGKRSLFVLSKTETWPLRFSATENPNMEKALFDQPIVLQYDVKAKYRLISGKFSGMKYFSPEHSLNQPKATRVCIRSINQSKSLYFRSFAVSVSSARFHIKVKRKLL